MRICEINDCGGKHFARGWCKKHYTRYERHGDPRIKKQPGMKITPIEIRFHEKYMPITETGCWIWMAATVMNYGVIGIGGRSKGNYLAHRLSWELHRGKIPEGMNVCHKCDNPFCVNPDHLFIGTQQDNVIDMHAKGRANTPHGENSGVTKITEETAREVLSMKGKMKASEASKHYKIPYSTIRGIWSRTRWKYL